MEKLSSTWRRLCTSSGVLRFVDINLRGVAQVMLQDNPLTGAFFLAAIGWGAYAAGVPHVALAGLIALVVSTLTAQWLRVDEASLRAGLFGYNGVLVGLALATFLAPGPLLWVYVVLGAAVSVVAMLGTVNAVKPLGLSALTFPFVLTTWLLLLATYGFAGLVGTALPAGSVVTPFQPYEANPLNVGDLVQGTLLSISQVFLKASGWAAVLLVVGLAVNSLAAAIFAVAGAVLAVVTAHLLGAESESDHRWPSGLQSGFDRDHAWHGGLSAKRARGGLRGGGHDIHGHHAIGAERRLDAAGHSSPYRAVRSRVVDLSPASAVFRGVNRHRREGWDKRLTPPGRQLDRRSWL